MLKMIVTFASEGDTVIDGTDFRSLLCCRILDKWAVLCKL